MVADRTLYDVLDVDPSANQQTISKVWKKYFLNKFFVITNISLGC